MVLAEQREVEAVKLRIQGLTFEAIAVELGVSREGARKALDRGMEALKEEAAQGAEELRSIQAARYEAIVATLWPRVMDGDLKAVDRVYRGMEGYRRLMGIDLEPERDGDGPQIVVIDSRNPWDRPDTIDGETVSAPELSSGGADA